jgi:hypothetical protein
MIENILNLIPQDKTDCSSIEKLKEIDVSEVEPILGKLLEWIQDINWPIAQELIKVLPRFHSLLIPHIKLVFESNDDIWKCWVLCLLKDFPADSVQLLYPEIERMAKCPTKSELEEGTNEYAIEVTQKFEITIK